MVSYTCKEDSHAECAYSLQQESGKKFRCSCGCHVVKESTHEFYEENEVEGEDEDEY